MFHFYLSILVIFILPVNGDDCQTCVEGRNFWCVESSECLQGFCGLNAQLTPCNTTISDVLNCPSNPQTGYEYSDKFARTVALPVIAAVSADDPDECLKNNLPSAAVFSRINVSCLSNEPAVRCTAYTAVDPLNKAILVSFSGSTGGNVQLQQEVCSYLNPLPAFFDVGHVYDYFYESFYSLLNGGLGNDTNTLHSLYPNYSIWVFGISLGGAQASIYASYVIKTGLYKPENVRLLTFGQPRTGDRDFAKWHDETFLYSYRVIHQNDIVPHLQFDLGKTQLWHHRFEVWYDNNMTAGQPYAICPEVDGPYCSNRLFQNELTWADHAVYFDINLYDWSQKGCPKL